MTLLAAVTWTVHSGSVMKDMQSRKDNRKIPIRKVGIKELYYPITVMDRRNKFQPTTASVNMYVNLPHKFKGTHMSRFVEILNRFHGQISVRDIERILHAIMKAFSSESAHLDLRFPYFLEKKAPVSGDRSILNYDCAFLASLQKAGKREVFDLVIEAGVPVTTVCPCSKEISRRGAHNQRSKITIKARTRTLVWFEELIEIAEQSASSPVFPLLKRADEKYVTERAYDHPRFVEDVVRAVALRLKKDRRITWFQVESENLESIHNHNAYAMVVSDRTESRW